MRLCATRTYRTTLPGVRQGIRPKLCGTIRSKAAAFAVGAPGRRGCNYSRDQDSVVHVHSPKAAFYKPQHASIATHSSSRTIRSVLSHFISCGLRIGCFVRNSGPDCILVSEERSLACKPHSVPILSSWLKCRMVPSSMVLNVLDSNTIAQRNRLACHWSDRETIPHPLRRYRLVKPNPGRCRCNPPAHVDHGNNSGPFSLGFRGARPNHSMDAGCTLGPAYLALQPQTL